MRALLNIQQRIVATKKMRAEVAQSTFGHKQADKGSFNSSAEILSGSSTHEDFMEFFKLLLKK
jgi:hypothetical protein